MNGYSSIYIVTAPSGTGKTTMTRRLSAEIPDLEFSISHTTRKQRSGEVDGEHYRFVTKSAFEALCDSGAFVEWAQVFGNYYGTAQSEINRIIKKGHRVLLEIDVQGAQQIADIYPEAALIFILPPSISTLCQRLKMRGTDDAKTRKRRLATAYQELQLGQRFKHFIVNDDLENAYLELKNFILYGHPIRITAKDGEELCKNLLIEFDRAAEKKDFPE